MAAACAGIGPGLSACIWQGHPKFPQARRRDDDDSGLLAMRGAAIAPCCAITPCAERFSQVGGHWLRRRGPGWDSLKRLRGSAAGGHPGGIFLLLQPTLVIAPDRVAIDARDASDLALRGIALQQRLCEGALIGFQDIHSFVLPRRRPDQSPANRCRRRRRLLLSPIKSGGEV